MASWRAFILGNPSGRYVQELRAAAPVGIAVSMAEFSSLHTGLGRPQPPADPGRVKCQESFWVDSAGVTPQDLVVVRSMSVGSLESIIFRMDALAGLERQGTAVLNPAKSLELAIDKYLSLSQLAQLGFPVPATHTSQTAEQALVAFEALQQNVVVKPLFGSEGRGLIRVCDIDHAVRVFRSLESLGNVIYQQQYVDHGGRDYRVLVLGERRWTIERHHPSDWRTNRARGATCRPAELPTFITDMAHEICRQLHLPFAGLDFVRDQSTHQYYLLEVNGVPGWQGIREAYCQDIAQQFWAFATRFREERLAGRR
jgi:RimK family alpha-L-glutamate ligase